MIANLPSPAAGSVEQWLWAFAAVLGIALLTKRLLVRHPPIEAEFITKADFEKHQAICHPRLTRIESDFARRDQLVALESKFDRLETSLHANREAILSRLDEMKSELIVRSERDRKAIHERINEISVQLARVDERTQR